MRLYIGYQLAYLYLTLVNSKGQGHAFCIFDCDCLAKVQQIELTLLLSSKRKSDVWFRLEYLYLTITHSEGQFWCLRHFVCEYLTNCMTSDNHCHRNRNYYILFQFTYLHYTLVNPRGQTSMSWYVMNNSIAGISDLKRVVFRRASACMLTFLVLASACILWQHVFLQICAVFITNWNRNEDSIQCK